VKSLVVTFTAPGRVELREERVADPGPREILIETATSLISTGTEGLCFRGDFDADSLWDWAMRYPQDPGYSHVGRVCKVGAEVTRFREGDRVFSTCSHRQFALVDADHKNLVKLPDDTADEDATWSWLAVVTQTGVRRGEHALGDTAAVIGLGPLGQLTAEYLRLTGAREVLAIDPAPSRLDTASVHGATACFCGTADQAQEFVAKHTDGRGADVVYDVTGSDHVLPAALRLVKNLGAVILISDCPHPTRQHLTHDVVRRQIKIIGTQNDYLPPQHDSWVAARQIPLFYQYLHRGQMRVADLVSHRFRPAEAAQAYALLQENRASTMGVVFQWM
jgi:2-desacetyl-2-hydroxyethyl bacteriochlorophyllide A dehydrogenase